MCDLLTLGLFVAACGIFLAGLLVLVRPGGLDKVFEWLLVWLTVAFLTVFYGPLWMASSLVPWLKQHPHRDALIWLWWGSLFFAGLRRGWFG